ncbi:hypothetical protein NQZ68_025733, partial [Dissostichus eleginoides]
MRRESLAAAVLPCWLLSVSLIIGVQAGSALCMREPRGEEDGSGSQPERRDLLRLQAGAKERRHRQRQAAAVSGRAIHVFRSVCNSQ